MLEVSLFLFLSIGSFKEEMTMRKGYKKPKSVIDVQGGEVPVASDGIGSRLFRKMIFIVIPVSVCTGFCVGGYFSKKFERGFKGFDTPTEQVVASATQPAK